MYVRVKTTPNSPRQSVQIVESVRKGDKVSQKILRYVGIAMNDHELVQLKQLAESIKLRMEAESSNRELLFSPEDIAKMTVASQEAQKISKEITEDDYKVNLKNLKEEDRIVAGIHDIYGALFDELGYNKVLKNPARHVSAVNMLKDVVLARIANPVSKRGTVTMLEEDFGITLNLELVYRMMDKLDDDAVERLNRISYENTQRLYNSPIDVVFFDCTTLYFEAFEPDELRQHGYSKDMKFNEVQVLFALMVTKEGLPIGYEVFKGATYEGHTLIPAIQELKEKYKIDQVVFVADSGMMNGDNIAEMEKEGIEYILGARLKNLPKKIQAQILNTGTDNPTHTDMPTGNPTGNHADTSPPTSRYAELRPGYKVARFQHQGYEIIVSYSESRAKKDRKDRERLLAKLKKKVAKDQNPKAYISNIGHKKYLKIALASATDATTVEIDEEKVALAQKWDGLLGVRTNAKGLTAEDVLKKYTELWQVEKAFRINKHDLKMRPVFHWKPSRVRAHVAITFMAFCLVKYLEYRVKLQYKALSPEVIRQTLIRVQTSILFDKTKKIRYGLPSKMSLDARKIYALMKVSRTCTPFILEKL